jgi:hypothetical protein
LDADTKKLVKGLRTAGLSAQAIDAAWPSWWSDEAAATASGRAELRFALARKLGLSPRSLLGERVEFVWKDEARFKNLTVQDAREQAAIASFGVVIARLLLQASPPGTPIKGAEPLAFRDILLSQGPFVDLNGLLAICWGVGIPVIHLRVYPLSAKSMRAMIVRVDDRHAILLGRDSKYPAPIAFTLAHEIGHGALGHIEGVRALVDIDDPHDGKGDAQEEEADAFGMALLTGDANPAITTNTDSFSARSLAATALKSGPANGIEPGTLALCVGYLKQNWPIAMAALPYIYAERKDVWREVNGIANEQIQWDSLGEDSAEYLRKVMSGADG